MVLSCKMLAKQLESTKDKFRLVKSEMEKAQKSAEASRLELNAAIADGIRLCESTERQISYSKESLRYQTDAFQAKLLTARKRGNEL